MSEANTGWGSLAKRGCLRRGRRACHGRLARGLHDRLGHVLNLTSATRKLGNRRKPARPRPMRQPRALRISGNRVLQMANSWWRATGTGRPVPASMPRRRVVQSPQCLRDSPRLYSSPRTHSACEIPHMDTADSLPIGVSRHSGRLATRPRPPALERFCSGRRLDTRVATRTVLLCARVTHATHEASGETAMTRNGPTTFRAPAGRSTPSLSSANHSSDLIQHT